MNVKTFEEVRQRFLEITFEERFDLIVAVANGGIIPAAMLNQRLNLDMQLLKLHLRDADQKQLYDRPRLLEEIRFEVKGKKNIIGRGPGKNRNNLEYARQLLLGAGAAVVKTFAVNGNADYCLYNEMCFSFSMADGLRSCSCV